MPELNKEVGRQVKLLVEQKGGSAGRIASGKVSSSMQGVLDRMRDEFWSADQDVSAKQGGTRKVTRLGEVVDLVTNKLFEFQSLAPARLWWRRMVLVSAIVMLCAWPRVEPAPRAIRASSF